MGVQFRRPAGQVDEADSRRPEGSEAILHGFPAHHLGAIRSRVNMTMGAGLVAELAHIDLEDLDALRPQRVEPDFRQFLRESRQFGRFVVVDTQLHQRLGQLMIQRS